MNQKQEILEDLEDSTRVIVICKDKQEKFEATHNVVYGKSSILDYSDRYYNTRHQFFEECINDGQETAVKKVLSKDINS